MSNLSRKRIAIDIKNYKNSDLDKNGIICKFNENNFYNVKALIIGPDDTPYEGGFYFFDINFTEKYPHCPPVVKLQTLNSTARFNPNLYTNGKVCLSILGTWSGPGWTSCLSLNTVLLSIQTLLNENPIQNEPGFENEVGETSTKYNKIITFQNLDMAVSNMITKPPRGFEEFIPDLENYFVKNYEKYINTINKNIDKNDELIKLRVYSLIQRLEYERVKSKFEHYYTCLKPKYSLIVENVSTTESNNEDTLPESTLVVHKKSKKRVPNEKANQYDVGTIIKSTNDQRYYIVTTITTKSNVSYKKWVLQK